MYLADCTTMQIILKDKKYFSQLTLVEANTNTISGPADLVEGSGRTNIMLSRETIFIINDVLFSSRSRKNLLCFKDISRSGYHIETKNDDDTEYLYITIVVFGRKKILQKLPANTS